MAALPVLDAWFVLLLFPCRWSSSIGRRTLVPLESNEDRIGDTSVSFLARAFNGVEECGLDSLFGIVCFDGVFCLLSSPS
eukprot:14661_4